MPTETAFRPVISARYEDPLDLIWTDAAARLGMTVVRDREVFAAWDGRGTLRIGIPETLDPDDSLAQMILHEICHALAEGPAAMGKPDWGLQAGNPAQQVREHACLRIQATLAGAQGLRKFFAATTSFRGYYDRLPKDPLADGDDPAIAIARDGWRRSQQAPWIEPLRTALEKTAAIAALVRPHAGADSLWAG